MIGIVRGGRNEGDYNVGDAIHYTKLGLTKAPKFENTTGFNPSRIYDYGWDYYITYDGNTLKKHSVTDDSIISSFVVITPNGYYAPSVRLGNVSDGGIDVDSSGYIYVVFSQNGYKNNRYVKKYNPATGAIVSEGSITIGYTNISYINTISHDGSTLVFMTSGFGSDQYVVKYNTANFTAISSNHIEYSAADTIQFAKASHNGGKLIFYNKSDEAVYSITIGSGTRTFLMTTTMFNFYLIGCWSEGFLIISHIGRIVYFNAEGAINSYNNIQSAFAVNYKLYIIANKIISKVDNINFGYNGDELASLDINFSYVYWSLNHVNSNEDTFIIDNEIFKSRFTIQD